jgi:hypothetical protein
VQPSNSDRVVDYVVAHAQRTHLLSGDDAVLGRGELPQAFLGLSVALFP